MDADLVAKVGEELESAASVCIQSTEKVSEMERSTKRRAAISNRRQRTTRRAMPIGRYSSNRRDHNDGEASGRSRE